jgi:hypothetical protein
MKFEGPFTAKALRDAMRDGSLDPFTLVTQDPATEAPRPIIDVGSIFDEGISKEDQLDSVQSTLSLDKEPEISNLNINAPQDVESTVLVDDEKESDSEEDLFVPSYTGEAEDVSITNRTEERISKDLEKSDNYIESVDPLIKQETVDLAKEKAKEKAEEALEKATEVMDNVSSAVGKYAKKIENNFAAKVWTSLTNNNLVVKGAKKKTDIKDTLFNKILQKAKNSTLYRSRQKDKQKKKKYLLVAKGTEYGPFTSAQIVQSYLKGRVSGRVTVKKIGENSKFSVEQFTRMYHLVQKNKKQKDHQLKKAMASAGDHNPGFGLSFDRKNPEQQPRNHKSFTEKAGMFVLVLFASAGMAFGGYYLYKEIKVNSSETRKVAVKQKTKNLKKYRTKVRTKKVSKTRTKSRPTSKRTSVARKAGKLSIPKNMNKSARKTYYKPSSRRTKKYSAPVTSKNVRAMSAKSLVRKRQRGTKKLHSVILNSKLHLKENKKATVGPLFYNLKTISGCKLKCTISMRDSSGQSIKVVFFKAGFEKKLKLKNGRVTVTGIVKSRGKTLILQSIR